MCAGVVRTGRISCRTTAHAGARELPSGLAAGEAAADHVHRGGAQVRQKVRVSGMTRIRISSRPASISMVSSHFAASGSGAKVQHGPMSGPRPGPTPPSAVAERAEAGFERHAAEGRAAARR